MSTGPGVGEAFVLFLIALSYGPVLRAYLVRRESPWLVAGFTALLVGRVASVVEAVTYPTALDLVEHGVGIALAAGLFALHFYREWRAEDSRYRSEQTTDSMTDRGR